MNFIFEHILFLVILYRKYKFHGQILQRFSRILTVELFNELTKVKKTVITNNINSFKEILISSLCFSELLLKEEVIAVIKSQLI